MMRAYDAAVKQLNCVCGTGSRRSASLAAPTGSGSALVVVLDGAAQESNLPSRGLHAHH
jgi:hypothetical protein